MCPARIPDLLGTRSIHIFLFFIFLRTHNYLDYPVQNYTHIFGENAFLGQQTSITITNDE